MRFLVSAAVGALVGALVVLAVLMFFPPGSVSPPNPGDDAVRVGDFSELNEKLATLENYLDRTRVELEMMEARIEQIQSARPVQPEYAPSERTEDAAEIPANSGPPALPGDFESEQFKELIRDQIKAVEEEKKKEWEERRKAMNPEEWEKDEFGNHAWQVHRMGVDLGLTVTQKRQYFPLIKEHNERVMSLWEELRKKNPDLNFKEQSKIYQEERKTVLRTTRNLVRNILNAGQQKKYDEMNKQNEWFK